LSSDEQVDATTAAHVMPNTGSTPQQASENGT